MKSILASMLLVLSFGASATAITTYKCAQNEGFSPVDPAVGKFSMTVQILDEVLAGPRSHADYHHNVRIIVKKKLNGKTLLLKDITSKGASADVLFTVNNAKKGVNVVIYMDEPDQSNLVLKVAKGKSLDITMDCGLN